MKIKSKTLLALIPFLWISFSSSMITDKTARDLENAICKRNFILFKNLLIPVGKTSTKERLLFFEKNPQLLFSAIELLPPAALQLIKMGNVFLPCIYHHVHTVPRFYDRFSEESRRDVKTARIDTPLHTAAEFGRAMILLRLLEAHEGKNRTNLRNTMGSTPLHVASTSRVAHVLLRAGARLDAKDIYNRTALECALNFGIKHPLLLASKDNA